MVKFLTCASYYGSGSSAVTDLLAEYGNVDNLTNFEFRFLHDPYGVRDLQYYLVDNRNRHNSGFGMKKFIKYTDFLRGNKFFKRYEHYLGKTFKEETEKYIESLVTQRHKAYWQYDLLERGKLYYGLSRLCFKLFHKDLFTKNIETLICDVDKERFIQETKKYVNNVFEKVLTDKDNFLMVDQLVPSSNIKDFLPYFDDIKIFLVDRDPRDVFLCEKYIWKSGVVPLSPEKFVEWFKYCRRGQAEEIKNDNVCFIRFEDLIYRYEETKAKIVDFAGLKEDLHSAPFKFFDPKVSIKNTKLYEKHKEDKANIEIIERELKDFLYE